MGPGHVQIGMKIEGDQGQRFKVPSGRDAGRDPVLLQELKKLRRIQAAGLEIIQRFGRRHRLGRVADAGGRATHKKDQEKNRNWTESFHAITFGDSKGVRMNGI